MAVYCHKCGKSHEFPMSAMRTSRAPCDFCNGFDEYEGFNKYTRKPETRRQLNYSYPDNLLPGTASDINTSAEKEYDSTP